MELIVAGDIIFDEIRELELKDSPKHPEYLDSSIWRVAWRMVTAEVEE